MFTRVVQALVWWVLDTKTKKPGVNFNQLVDFFRHHLDGRSDYRMMEDIVLPLLDFWMALQGNKGLETLKYISWYGKLLVRKGEYEQAEKILQQLFQCSEELCGSERVVTLRVMSFLSGDLVFRGKHDEALKLAQLELERRKRISGSHPLNLPMRMCSVASLLSHRAAPKGIGGGKGGPGKEAS